MAIAVYFSPKGMTEEQYLNIHRRLEAAGVGLREQQGRLHHSCFGEDGDLMVYDIWESPEAFENFGKVLLPILADLGIDAGTPAITPVHLVDQVSIEAKIPSADE